MHRYNATTATGTVTIDSFIGVISDADVQRIAAALEARCGNARMYNHHKHGVNATFIRIVGRALVAK